MGLNNKIQQCRECKRLFESLYDSTICPACVEKMDKEFLVVKDYVYDHPDANVIKVSVETGIPVKRVLNMLREGRLSIADANGMMTCMECGKQISSGKYCNDCLGKIEKELKSIVKIGAAKRSNSSAVKGRMGRIHSDYDKRYL